MNDARSLLQDEDIVEFNVEANELLDSCEQNLLNFDSGEFNQRTYDTIFRGFHSIKGAAGMLGLIDLQNHFHKLETQFQSCKGKTISKAQVSYFLHGVDTARLILNGKSFTFDYTFPDESKITAPLQATTSHIEEQNSKEIGNSTSLNLDPGDMIFIIDDEPDLVKILVNILKLSKINAIGFTDGQSAIEALKKQKPNVILTDYKMPTMSGLDVLKTVKSIDHDIPVIFLSANLHKDTLIEAVEHNIFGVLEKPFQESQVITMCMSASRKSKLTKLFNRSVNFILYQINDLQKYLDNTGQHEVKSFLNNELKMILEARRQLKRLK